MNLPGFMQMISSKLHQEANVPALLMFLVTARGISVSKLTLALAVLRGWLKQSVIWPAFLPPPLPTQARVPGHGHHKPCERARSADAAAAAITVLI